MIRYNDLINNAKDFTSQGKIQEAVNQYEQAFEIDSEANDLIDAGFLYLELKNYEESFLLFSVVVQADPKNPRGYYALALWYEEKEEYIEALKNLEKATTLDSFYIDAWFDMGRILEEIKDDDRALKCYQRVLLFSPRHFWACLNLGSLYERQDKLDDALLYTNKAYDINSNMKMVNYNLGVINARLGNYEEAIKNYLEEIKKEDGFYQAYYNLGLIYKDIYKDYEKAKLYYLMGISKAKDNYFCWYNLGCVYALCNQYEDAYNCLYYAITKRPDLRNGLENDEDLQDFIKTKNYQKLMNC